MTVSELIAWLRQQPADAKVLLHDPDTGFFLEPKFGPNEHVLEWSPENLPEGAIVLHSTYFEE